MPEFEITFEPGYIVQFLFAIILLIVIIFIIYKVKKFLRPKDEIVDREMVKRKWQEIEQLLEQNTENSYKLAIMEADKLLDYALKAKMLPGNDLGGRLKVACARNPKLKSVWPAHIARNKIVHDPHYIITKNTAYNAIKRFKYALNILGVL